MIFLFPLEKGTRSFILTQRRVTTTDKRVNPPAQTADAGPGPRGCRLPRHYILRALEPLLYPN